MRDTQAENSQVLRDFCGTLLCSPVLDACNGRPDPQVFDQFVANGIKQLPYGLACEICGWCSRAALTRQELAFRGWSTPARSYLSRVLTPPSILGCLIEPNRFGASSEIALLRLVPAKTSGTSGALESV